MFTVTYIIVYFVNRFITSILCFCVSSIHCLGYKSVLVACVKELQEDALDLRPLLRKGDFYVPYVHVKKKLNSNNPQEMGSAVVNNLD